MKKSLFPVVFLVMAFVVILFADDTLFEGIKMTERLMNTNTVNNAYVILSAGTVLDPRCGMIVLGGTNGSQVTLEACDIAGNPRMILKAGTDTLMDWQAGTLTIANSGSDDISIGHPAKTTTFAATTVAIAGAANWGGGDLLWSGVGSTLSNLGNFTSVKTITASNFVQSAGSMGGFVGNGSGLTNLPGTSVGGFTPGSTIFAGASGALSQDNANYFWDITNRRLGLGTSSPGALLGMVVTNGVQNFIMMDGYSSTPDLITRTANGTFASPTAVTNGQILSAFSARGYGTTGFPTFGSARIRFEASEAFTDTAKGSRIVFFTTASTTTNVTEVMRIHNDGSVGIGTNAIVANVKLDVNGPLQVEGPAIITSSGPITNIIGSVSGLIPSVYITNVSCDFPSTLTLAGADLSFNIPATILTNSVVTIGRPPTEITGLVTMGLMTNNGIVVIRARNVTAGTIDQAALPYRIQVTVNPTQ